MSKSEPAARRKTPGACERCREKRIKCNGAQPCDQCSKRDMSCNFTFALPLGSDVLLEKLDLVLSRMDRLEEAFRTQITSTQSEVEHPSVRTGKSCLDPDSVGNTTDKTEAAGYRAPSLAKGVAQLNQQTGCFEYYGGTSTFVAASSLGKRMRQLEETVQEQRPSKQRRGDRILTTSDTSHLNQDSIDLDELTGFCDYVMPPNALRQHRHLREIVTDRHLDKFFSTIHIFLPIFDKELFLAKYNAHKPLFGDHRLYLPSPEYPSRQQYLCLLFSVLALGALYENDEEDSSSWASWYFAEAQDCLGRLLAAANLELVQAAMLMGAYAQHAIKPNLAYILNGIATRLAFSIGLNTENIQSSRHFQAQELKRTWWLLYIQEVELSLDSGRPLCIRTSDMDLEYPVPQTVDDAEDAGQQSQVDFIRYLAEIAKIMRKILKLVNVIDISGDLKSYETKVLQNDLQSWMSSLPAHLRFHGDMPNAHREEFSPASWQARQQSSLRIHYNLAIIILLRPFLGQEQPELADPSLLSTISCYQKSCLDAAKDMVKHIHHIFGLEPSLRRWSYYCFYCLQSTLVLLTKIVSDAKTSSEIASHPLPASIRDDRIETLACCEIGIRVFEQIELKASQRCAEVVRRFLEKWRARMQPRSNRDENRSTVEAMGREKGHVEGRLVRGKNLRSHLRPSTRGSHQQGRSYSSTSEDPHIIAHPENLTSPNEHAFPSSAGSESLDLLSHGPRSTAKEASNISGVLPRGESVSSTTPRPGAEAFFNTSPPISLDGLQTALYSALHGYENENYGFGLEQPGLFFGSDFLHDSDFVSDSANFEDSGHRFVDESGQEQTNYAQNSWL